MKSYKPIDCGFHDLLEATITRREYAQVWYRSPWEEVLRVTTMLCDLETVPGPEGPEEYLLLGTGERVRLDQLVSVNGTFAPPYGHYHDFTCDC